MHISAVVRGFGLCVSVATLGFLVPASPASAATGTTVSYISYNSSTQILAAHCRTFGWSSSQKVSVRCQLEHNDTTVEDLSRTGSGSASTPTWTIGCPLPGRWTVIALGPSGQSDYNYVKV